jgi:hypothetical protein
MNGKMVLGKRIRLEFQNFKVKTAKENFQNQIQNNLNENTMTKKLLHSLISTTLAQEKKRFIT